MEKCIQPGIDYFSDKFGSDGVHPVATFRALQIFHPQTAYEMGPTAASVDELRVVPFLSEQIENLKQEHPIISHRLHHLVVVPTNIALHVCCFHSALALKL